MVELIPIVVPTIDWPKYLSVVNQALGVSISNSFDAAKIPTSPRAFAISLNELSQTYPALDIDTPCLRHLSYTFLAVMLVDTYYELVETAPLAFTSSESTRPGIRVTVISGTLAQWQQAVVHCSNSTNVDIRKFSDKVKTFFDNLGLDMWKHYLKIKLPDKTLKLVSKT